jgi:two-component system KDP operon response regulator KdpE
VTRLLVVDDEAPFLRALAISLRAHGYDVVTAATGSDALEEAARSHPDAVVLDLGLPDIDGLEVLAGLRGWTMVPVVVLSARQDDAMIVAALDAGADDYVTKPFSMNELLARVRAALRRAVVGPDQPTVRMGLLLIDLAAKTVARPDGEVIRLTPTEWQVLEILVRNEGKLVTQRQLLRDVWGPQYERETNYLRVYLAGLRRKLEPTPSRPRYLITEPGMGYRFVNGDEEPD